MDRSAADSFRQLVQLDKENKAIDPSIFDTGMVDQNVLSALKRMAVAGHAGAAYNFAQLLHKHGEVDEASSWYRKSAKLPYGDVDIPALAYLKLGEIAASTSSNRKAAKEWHRAEKHAR